MCAVPWLATPTTVREVPRHWTEQTSGMLERKASRFGNPKALTGSPSPTLNKVFYHTKSTPPFKIPIGYRAVDFERLISSKGDSTMAISPSAKQCLITGDALSAFENEILL